jgi:hypothetical protein
VVDNAEDVQKQQSQTRKVDDSLMTTYRVWHLIHRRDGCLLGIHRHGATVNVSIASSMHQQPHASEGTALLAAETTSVATWPSVTSVTGLSVTWPSMTWHIVSWNCVTWLTCQNKSKRGGDPPNQCDKTKSRSTRSPAVLFATMQSSWSGEKLETAIDFVLLAALLMSTVRIYRNDCCTRFERTRRKTPRVNLNHRQASENRRLR